MDAHLPVIIAIGLSLAMAGAWAIQRTTGLSGWIDTIWSFAVGLGGIIAAVFADGSFDRRMTVLVLISSLGLAARQPHRIAHQGGTEDPRYAKFIEDWGDRAATRLFVFLQIQAIVAFVLVLAVHLAAGNDAAFPALSMSSPSSLALWRSAARHCPTPNLPAFARHRRQRRRSSRSRFVALFPPSQLFFRMALLVLLSAFCAGPADLELAFATCAAADVLAPGAYLRHSAARRAYASFARRKIPSLAKTRQRLLSRPP